MSKILTTENILSLRVAISHGFVIGFDNSVLSIHKLIKMNTVSSNRPMYLLWEKFMIIHCRKTRNLDEFPFRMAYNLQISKSFSPSRSIVRDIYLTTNLSFRQASKSNLCIHFGIKISSASHRFRTKDPYEGSRTDC